MKITYFGHSTFSVSVNNKILLFDPFITGNPLAAAINIDSVKADYILVSHGHSDHIGDLVYLAKRTGAMVICAWEIHVWLHKQGVTNTHPMNTGGKWKFDFGHVKCVSAIHSSGLPDGSYGGNPMGFIVESTEGNFYYSGDTALTYDMQLIGSYRKVDFAFLCMGDNFTMSVDNAIIASDFIKCDRIIGMHYDTFEYIKINKADAIEKFNRNGKELHLIPIGQTLDMEKQQLTSI
jgi:L-ascorbate metabolism protein UlaG (beta-lactamase superfamily)